MPTMTSCSNTASVGRLQRGRGPANPHPAPSGGGFFALLFCLFFTPVCLAAAPPLEPIPARTVLVNLPETGVSAAPTSLSADALAAEVRHQLKAARQQGDPRFLGYAQRALDQWPTTRLTSELQLLRGSLRQSLHQFDEAEADLKAVLKAQRSGPLRSQAWLTLASIRLVRGDYAGSRQACEAFADDYPGLIAASCFAQVDARTGQARAAYERLSRAAHQSRSTRDPVSRAWAEGTLASLAAQLGLDAAQTHWRRVLVMDPGDLYSRALYADWLLQQDQPEAALALTRGYEQVDSLAVLKAIALKRSQQDDREFEQRLAQRFAEARWRGNLLHKRDYARYLLDVGQQPEAAFRYARLNWQSQREPLDTRLLLRAATAAGETSVRQDLVDWLADNHQSDARYPETTP